MHLATLFLTSQKHQKNNWSHWNALSLQNLSFRLTRCINDCGPCKNDVIFFGCPEYPPHVMKTPNTNVPANVSNLCTLRWQWYMYRKYQKETLPMSPTRQKVGLSMPHFDYVIFARSPIACIRWLVWFVRYICWLKKCSDCPLTVDFVAEM